MLESARQWFQISQDFEADSENVALGMAIVKLKQMNFIDTLAIIT